MSKAIAYCLIPLMSCLMVAAQAFWGSAIKNQKILSGSFSEIIVNVVTSWRIWAGISLYVCATAVYFILLSKNKFFSVQITLAALAIVFSTLLSYILFHEKISTINLFGMCLVLTGIVLVFMD